ncbi:PREDICTED: uncharacterized protein LOC104803064 [Tarenaya hassleriana]|uniref:uncharacterized protein LOC104803064 n=1 Tax=Tarenaya hassleriana TaxID=28532 RepID=UPI00053C0CED|nr:PREDICTED: uncharacterized protein LOC104803064 [Tarenaya hassleriana]
MAEQDQARPLAPAAVRPVSDGATVGYSTEKNRLRRRNHIRCFGCVAVTVLVLAVTVLILAFTVFRVKEPKIQMNSIKITSLDISLGPQILQPLINVSMAADLSIKNPNSVSFKFGNTTTEVYYHGTVVGVARGPPGKARARRTMRMNITMDILADRMLSSGGDLVRDVGSGSLNMTAYTVVGGKVNILGIVKKHVTVKMNCTVVLSLSSRDTQGFKCKRKVHL